LDSGYPGSECGFNSLQVKEKEVLMYDDIAVAEGDGVG
jgi:hypothetical protein